MEIKFFKREKHFEKEGSWLNLNLFWDIAVCLVLLSILGAMIFGYYLFMETIRESTPGDAPLAGQIETVKKDRIDKVLQYFSVQKQKSTQIINSPAPLVDPSL
jgi:hypothetical protein